jgi:hypothetical protein
MTVLERKETGSADGWMYAATMKSENKAAPATAQLRRLHSLVDECGETRAAASAMVWIKLLDLLRILQPAFQKNVFLPLRDSVTPWLVNAWMAPHTHWTRGERREGGELAPVAAWMDGSFCSATLGTNKQEAEAHNRPSLELWN